MITYNEAKQLLSAGILPCIIYKNIDGEGTNQIDYIMSYYYANNYGYECESKLGSSYRSSDPNDELEVN